MNTAALYTRGDMFGALVLGMAMGLIVGAMALAVWLDLSGRIDDATRLPAKPRPRPFAVDDTTRLDNSPICDLPRRGSLIDRTL